MTVVKPAKEDRVKDRHTDILQRQREVVRNTQDTQRPTAKTHEQMESISKGPHWAEFKPIRGRLIQYIHIYKYIYTNTQFRQNLRSDFMLIHASGGGL